MDFEQRQKRSRKLFITDEVINSMKKLNILDDTIKDELLFNWHRYLLRLSKKRNNSDEVGIILFHSEDEVIYHIMYGSENNLSFINYPDVKSLVDNTEESVFIFMHNHPKNSSFSEIDLKSFLYTPSIYLMTAVGNDGRVYSLQKTKSYNQYTATSYYSHIFETVKQGSAVDTFLYSCKNCGLIYKCGGI